MIILGFFILLIVGILCFVSGIYLWYFQKNTKRPLKGYLKSLIQLLSFGLVIIALACIVGGVGLFFLPQSK